MAACIVIFLSRINESLKAYLCLLPVWIVLNKIASLISREADGSTDHLQVEEISG